MSAYEANSCTFILLTCLDTLKWIVKIDKEKCFNNQEPGKKFNPYWPSNKWATVSTAII